MNREPGASAGASAAASAAASGTLRNELAEREKSEAGRRPGDVRRGRMNLRPATPDDIGAIARLHADSWRRNYRGAYSDEFLDGGVVADRLATWTDRFAPAATTSTCTIVAELDGVVIGFAHTVVDDDPQWGSLGDNLHVAHGPQ